MLAASIPSCSSHLAAGRTQGPPHDHQPAKTPALWPHLAVGPEARQGVGVAGTCDGTHAVAALRRMAEAGQQV